jgi:hypothetical protein
MNLFQIIGLLDPGVAPADCKIHLAGWNGLEDPLDVYLAGGFDEWQSWQTKRNFERPFVVSLINISPASHWVFAGVYDSNGCEWVEEHKMHHYHLDRRVEIRDLEGRLIVRFERGGRQSYLLAENWHQAINVAEIRPERIQIAAFPGYSSTMIRKRHLDIVTGTMRTDTAADGWPMLRLVKICLA